MVEYLSAAAIVLILFIGVLAWFLRNPVLVPAGGIPDGPGADPVRLEDHVRRLASSEPSRAFHNVAALNQAADYVETEFRRAGCNPVRQTFNVGGNDYHNIICSYGPSNAARVVIGGHYDVAGDDNPGADDNASAVSALLELARMLDQQKPNLNHRLDLVAFSLEEPPNFRSETMGSYVHAAGLAADRTDVKLMISVEMIGYFSDRPGSQAYPLSILRLFYPGKGDFIGVVGRSFDRSRVARVKQLMQASERMPVYSINAPAIVPGVDLSDHWGFWQHGLPAIMVTDTAFLRNPNYHLPTDTPDTLDYDRMALVVDGLYRVAVAF